MGDHEGRQPAQGATSAFSGEEDEGVAVLLTRFRAGDTDAVGDFVSRYGPLIRAHYRRRIGRSMQRLVDSQDLLSTIARRLCQRVSNRRIRAVDRRQLWAMVYRIGDGALVDRVRVLARLRSLEADSSEFVHMLRERLDRPEDVAGAAFAEELAAMLASLETEIDRRLLVMWLHGTALGDAGAEFGLSAAATRKRWERIRGHLRQQFHPM
ncbi:MAG TPA: ECF-type sigma factor [Phycisphaerales bacterium]|nr:ECF-type sigma factor [Phycisphaerales bacterium]